MNNTLLKGGLMHQLKYQPRLAGVFLSGNLGGNFLLSANFPIVNPYHTIWTLNDTEKETF